MPNSSDPSRSCITLSILTDFIRLLNRYSHLKATGISSIRTITHGSSWKLGTFNLAYKRLPNYLLYTSIVNRKKH